MYLLEVYLYFVGHYQQFDTMVLPQIKARITKSNVMKWLDWSTITVPAPPAMRSQCMEIFLEPTKNIFCNGIFNSNFSIQDAIVGCLGLFGCVYIQWIEHEGRVEKWTVEGVKCVSYQLYDESLLIVFYSQFKSGLNLYCICC